MTTVAGISANVTTVAGISANVTTVAGIAAAVTTVAGISAAVSTVATNAAAVSTVATNIADVNTVAANIATISAKVSKSGDTMTGKLITAASASGAAGLNLPHGTAPSAPVDGDLWTTSALVQARINGTTQTLATLAGGTFTGGIYNVGGSVSATSFGRGGQTNTGLYFPSTTTVGISTNGTQRVLYDANGQTLPSQPMLEAYASATLSDVTGDGTSYTVVFNTETVDRGSNFASGTTWTCPVTGFYHFTVDIRYSGHAVGNTTANLSILPSAGGSIDATWNPGVGISGNGSNEITLSGGIYLPSGTTVQVKFQVYDLTKVVDITEARFNVQLLG